MSRPYHHPDYREALELQRSIGVLDMHVDSIIQQRLFGYNIRQRHGRRFLLPGQLLFWHADLPRMQEAGYRGACMGIHYYPWESEKGWLECKRQIDYLDQVCKEDPDVLRVYHPDDWDRAREAQQMALAPGVEGAHMLNGDLGRLEELSRRGAVYLTLVHFSKNRAASPSMGRGSNERDGLTDFGKDLVRALNRWGIAVDCAHVNSPGTLDACRVSQAPVFCTHTGVKAIRDHKRNVGDDEIDAIAETGGAIGVMCAVTFMSRFWGRSEAIADHVDHIVQRVGIDHVCLGTDFDGWIPLMRDQRDCLDLVKTTFALMQRGYTREDLEKLFHGNVIRVFKAVYEARDA